MRWCAGKCRVDVGKSLRQRLPGQTVHQVEIEIVEVAGGDPDRQSGFAIVVDAAEGRQVPRVETLDSQRQAVDAGSAKGGKLSGFDGSRIGFEGDFGVRQQGKAAAHGGKELVDSLAREQAGRSTADEDAVNPASPDQGQRRFQVGDQGREVIALGDRRLPLANAAACRQGVRVEVAVRTLLHAPGNMDVQRQRRGVAELDGVSSCRCRGPPKQRDDRSGPAARHQRSRCRRSTRRASAWPRCERRFFSAASSSAALLSSSRM